MLLVHKPGRMDVSEDGLLILDSYDLVQEKEAEWLSGCLLLPREALLHITRKSMNVEEAENRYHVSNKMMLYRQGVTGVNKQFNRARGRA
jgi:Zn-dependent peptidase ImmA (M78 family)